MATVEELALEQTALEMPSLLLSSVFLKMVIGQIPASGTETLALADPAVCVRFGLTVQNRRPSNDSFMFDERFATQILRPASFSAARTSLHLHKPCGCLQRGKDRDGNASATSLSVAVFVPLGGVVPVPFRCCSWSFCCRFSQLMWMQMRMQRLSMLL